MSKMVIPNEEFSVKKECRICGSKKLFKFLSLGYTPLANSFLDAEKLNEPEKYYPLEICLCQDCYLVQLLQIVYPHFLFRHYLYLTSASLPMKEHFYNLTQELIRKFNFNSNSLVVDIGSNDGTLLSNFLNLKFEVLGIEPATNIAKLAQEKGIRTLNDFFNKQTAMQTVKDFGKAKVILATNVFAHVDDLDDFLKGIDCLLDDEGVFLIELPYLLNFLEGVEFDTIYHEHLSYFSVHPLVRLFKKFNMYIVNIKKDSIHGGSLRLFVQKKKPKSSDELDEFLFKEEKAGIKNISIYIDFSRQVAGLKEKLLVILNELKTKNRKICGYGASAKSNTLLNYCHIGTNFIDYIVDSTPFKQGKYTPGTHIPIFAPSKFYEDFSDYTLLLAWNYWKYIAQKEKGYREQNGKFIIPIPEPIVV